VLAGRVRDGTLLAYGAGVTSGIRVFTRDEKRRLTEQHFHNVDLGGVDLTGADLQGSAFEDCRLSACDFRAADLRAVRFLRCDLRDAQFAGARLGDNQFDGSCLAGASGLSALQLQYVAARGGSITEPEESTREIPETE
jgi:uncharacterized protein YjbI with pentapeptide repeats